MCNDNFDHFDGLGWEDIAFLSGMPIRLRQVGALGYLLLKIAAWVESAAYRDFSKARRHIRILRKLTNLC